MLILAFSSSCAQFFDQSAVSQNNAAGNVESGRVDIPFEGSFTREDGETVYLADLKDRPVVLMFASRCCEYCIEEAVEVLKTMDPEVRNTDVVNFVTVLVDMKDMDLWRSRLPGEKKPAWLHGYDEPGKYPLYKTFFPEARWPSTPSLVLYSPFQDQIVTHIGKGAPDENQTIIEFIRSFVGRW